VAINHWTNIGEAAGKHESCLRSTQQHVVSRAPQGKRRASLALSLVALEANRKFYVLGERPHGLEISGLLGLPARTG
jgi:hypothetical protein